MHSSLPRLEQPEVATAAAPSADYFEEVPASSHFDGCASCCVCHHLTGGRKQLPLSEQVLHPLYCEALAVAATALAAPPPAAPPWPMPYLFGSPEYLQVRRLLTEERIIFLS